MRDGDGRQRAQVPVQKPSGLWEAYWEPGKPLVWGLNIFAIGTQNVT